MEKKEEEEKEEEAERTTKSRRRIGRKGIKRQINKNRRNDRKNKIGNRTSVVVILVVISLKL